MLTFLRSLCWTIYRKEGDSNATRKKVKFGECEIELIAEVEVYCLGGSVEASQTKGNNLNGNVTEAVNSVGSTFQIVAKVKEKWLDIKAEAKTLIAAYRQSVASTGGGHRENHNLHCSTTECAPGPSGVSREARAYGHVLTDDMLQSQRDIITAVEN